HQAGQERVRIAEPPQDPADRRNADVLEGPQDGVRDGDPRAPEVVVARAGRGAAGHLGALRQRLKAPSASSRMRARTPAAKQGPPPGTAAASMASRSSRLVAPCSIARRM